KYMVFDKTGTLTTGDFSIKSFDTQGVSKDEAASIIVGLESYSSHPIAQSLVKELQGFSLQRIVFTEVNELKGIGIKAIDADGNRYEIGSKKIIGEQADDKVSASDVYLKRNDIVISEISIEDELKPDAKE